MSNTMSTSSSTDQSAHRLRHVVLISSAAAMGGFLFGYDSAVINGAVEGIRGRFDIGSATLGTVIGIALLGAAVGAMTAGRLADRIGRRRVMQIAALFFAISGIGSMLPFTVWDLSVWRALGGVAIGMASVIGPAYIAEVAPAEHRGKLGSLQQAAIVLGIAISQLVNFAILGLAGGDQRGPLLGLEAWQIMLGIEVLPALVYGFVALRIPESPRYLVARGQIAEAKLVLADIERAGTDLDAEVARIDTQMHSDHKPQLRDLLGGRAVLLPIVWIGIALALFQQMSGINVIFYYSATLWQSVGIDASSSFFYSFTSSIINIIGTIIAILLIDRIGRKTLLVVGSVGMALSLGTAAWAFSFLVGQGDDAFLPDPQATIALIAVHAFVLFFASTWGVILWVLLSEMFPNRIRVAALGVGCMVVWITNWLITVTFPSMADWSLSVSYFIFAAFAAVSAPFVILFVRETKGKTLEDLGSVRSIHHSRTES
ncbi:MFS transporter [Rhodococcus sp. WMMA185]|uniref:sugar porter family MFS transporter n=1 Tax=Rhodococcus sp. WMMA185 TaxID=679318 RepID=UPI0008784B7F|nr:sugar porter family MFS transporter [Rhodococcus sp. WMMA185]AOW92608.1 MFS transporter [Rhodococcus sp. WMMA185]